MDAHKLQDVPLFQGLSSKDLDRLGPMVDEVDVGANRPLAVEDTLGHEFFVLLEGTCEVRVGDETVAELHAGDFFGEIALLERDRRTATVIATTPARVAVMTRSAFRDMSRRYPEIGERLRTAIDERMSRAAS
ncbi:MAG TPA: cyclic nucleotide-binding domain-containing protein [Gaiellales bacterium]|jgi:CRP-like cAMP-binding protein|nr:cyclic nucleotide-binding domain-containing protein [Gaiellales bacterium]